MPDESTAVSVPRSILIDDPDLLKRTDVQRRVRGQSTVTYTARQLLLERIVALEDDNNDMPSLEGVNDE